MKTVKIIVGLFLIMTGIVIIPTGAMAELPKIIKLLMIFGGGFSILIGYLVAGPVPTMPKKTKAIHHVSINCSYKELYEYLIKNKIRTNAGFIVGWYQKSSFNSEELIPVYKEYTKYRYALEDFTRISDVILENQLKWPVIMWSFTSN